MNASSEKRYARGADHVERLTCFVMAVALAMLVVGVNMQVAVRCLLCYVPEWTGDLVQLLSWTQEWVQYAFVWMVYLGIGVGVRRGLHLRIDLLDSSLGHRGRRCMAIFVDLACFIMVAIFVIAGAVVAWRTRLHVSPAMGLSMAVVYLVFPLSGLTLLVFLVESILWGKRPADKDESGGTD